MTEKTLHSKAFATADVFENPMAEKILEKTLSSKDFAVADVFENGADSLVGAKEENAKLIAQSQKSGLAAKLAAAVLPKRYPKQAERVENPLNLSMPQVDFFLTGIVCGRRSERE